MARLEGKTAMIIGGGSGIGKATALAFAREGAQLVVAEIRKEIAEALAEEIENQGGEALPFETDVSDETQVDATVRDGLERFGKIDILVNSAGGGSTRDGPVT